MRFSRLGLIILLVLLGLGSGGAYAQTDAPSYYTIPSPVSSLNVSGTIASTNAFQQVFAAAGSPGSSGIGGAVRKACTIQNNGTHNMYVTEGLGIGASSLTNSVILAAGQFYYCNWNGIVLKGQINITGTSGDAFYAAQQ